jgi:UDP-2-acetamido-3-amino-2,3-dideoxy-glucuronate N-acetyltransferase
MDDSPYIHPRALCESQTIGRGTRIWAFAHVMKDVHIGSDCNICDHVFIESGVYIGDRVTIKNGSILFEGARIKDEVFIGPGVVFTNDRYPRNAGIQAVKNRYREKSNWLKETNVGRGVTIGGRAVISPGVSLGDFTLVASGAVVTKDTRPHSLVVGVPGRERGWVCVCGFVLKGTEDSNIICPECESPYNLLEGMLVPGA